MIQDFVNTGWAAILCIVVILILAKWFSYHTQPPRRGRHVKITDSTGIYQFEGENALDEAQAYLETRPPKAYVKLEYTDD